jgi:hypothetical protein
MFPLNALFSRAKNAVRNNEISKSRLEKAVVELSAARIVMEKIGLLRSEERAAADVVSKDKEPPSPSSLLNPQVVVAATMESRRNSLLVSGLMDDPPEFQSADALRAAIDNVMGQPSDLGMLEANEGTTTITINIQHDEFYHLSLPVLRYNNKSTFCISHFCCLFASRLK